MVWVAGKKEPILDNETTSVIVDRTLVQEKSPVQIFMDYVWRPLRDSEKVARDISFDDHSCQC